MNNLLEPKSRKQFLQSVLADTGLITVPELVRPSWVVGASFGIAVLIGVSATIIVAPSHSFFSNNVTGYPLFFGILSAILAGWFLARTTRWMRREFGRQIFTVGELSRWIVAQGPTLHDPPTSRWTREQVSLKVREIVIEALGCEKTYREDANFVKDLGLS
jgi:hypothetical protein